jgi:hypothetical protein
MTPEQLQAQREQFIREREYLQAWDDAIQENYRRIRAKHDERKYLSQFKEVWE